MHVANLELCKELYELSGWEDTAYLWWPAKWTENKTTDVVGLHINAEDISPEILNDLIPAYDLGYLLRKLPATIKGKLNTYMLHSAKSASDRYTYYYTDDQDRIHNKGKSFAGADTPEYAAAKLAIELFKQGILTK